MGKCGPGKQWMTYELSGQETAAVDVVALERANLGGTERNLLVHMDAGI